MNSNKPELTYEKFIKSIPPFRDKMSLDGIKALLHQLNNFHTTLNVIHVAGTNGKGSSVSMLSSIYTASGQKVGTFTSPYIFDYRECIHINNTIIDIPLMNLATLKVSAAYEELILQQLPLPTHYECITVIALLSMYLENVDIAIIEVLMGGLNDATNVFTSPLVTLITSISLDHTEYLGSTLELIAVQKAGIIKQNCFVVVNKNNSVVIEVMKDTIKLLEFDSSNFLFLSEHFCDELYSKEQLTLFNQHLSLLGQHQQNNLKGVLSTIQLLQNKFSVTKQHILQGLSTINHPCRIEKITYHSLDFIVDGSHNEEGIKALSDFLQSTYHDTHFVFILGILEDKDQEMIKSHIYNIANEVILTKPMNTRTFNPDVFYQHLTSEQQKISTVIPDINDVYDFILNNKKQATNTLFIACGSLYVSYPFRSLITN